MKRSEKFVLKVFCAVKTQVELSKINVFLNTMGNLSDFFRKKYH